MADLYVANKKKESLKKAKKSYPQTEEIREIEKHPTTNPLASFVAAPRGVRFETQDKEEEILLLLRRHWITNVRWALLGLLLFISPLVLKFFPLISFLPIRFQIFSLILWYLLIIAFVFEEFLTWFFNVYIITDERVVDIDFYSLLYKQLTEAKIDRIQDITFKMGGAIRTFFNYGDVLIQTAGAEPNLEFEAVPNPERVVKVLQELRTQEEIEALEGRVR